VDEALASVRAEGLEPSAEGLRVLDAVGRGEIDTDEARARLLAHYRR
jgi:hypothetical protein